MVSIIILVTMQFTAYAEIIIFFFVYFIMSIKIIVVLAALVFVIIGVPDSQDWQFY